MAKVTKRTFSLSEEQAAFIDKKVASGNYVSGSEVVREGLRAIQERDAALERWLREEVVPTLERLDADPSRGLTIDEVFDSLDSHHERRLRSDGEASKSRHRA